MKTASLFIAFLFFNLSDCKAQGLFDRIWLMGSSVPKVIFEIDTVLIVPTLSNEVYPVNSLASICDENGTFQFYTNGMQIGNMDGDTILNGGQLADSIFYSQTYFQGYPNAQGVLILPRQGKEYYVFSYSYSDTAWSNGNIHSPDRFYYSLIDMGLDNGAGAVVSKRNTLYSNLFGDGRLTACRHANGRDWWVVHRGHSDNCYHTYLATSDTITAINIQCLGPNSLESDLVGQAVFSADGSRYASVTANSEIAVLNFDRCTGQFSNPIAIHYPAIPPYYCDTPFQSTCSGGNGMAFSPNGRFLYVNTIYYIDQFDLWADTIEKSRITLGLKDSSFQNSLPFRSQYLCPDGRIYISSYGGGSNKYSLIKNPDEKAPTCNFMKESFVLPTVNANSISNYPNMRLGKVPGGACDTVSRLQDLRAEPLAVHVYPNPANAMVNFDLTAYQDYHPNQMVYLYNTDGRLIKTTTLPYMHTAIAVQDLPAGVYFYEVVVGSVVRAKGKVMVMQP